MVVIWHHENARGLSSRMKKRLGGLLILCFAGTVGGGLGTYHLDDRLGWKQERLYRKMLDYSKLSAHDYKGSLLIKPNAIIALSNAAEGLANYSRQHPERRAEVSKALGRMAAMAIHPAINYYARPISEVHDLGEQGVYLGHLNVVLGSYQAITGRTDYSTLNRRISHHLARLILSDSRSQIVPYVKSKACWPADTVAALYSLYLYDRTNRTTLGKKPLEQWLTYMTQKGTDPESGLHYSDVSRTLPYWKYPRGCALSWTTHYLSAMGRPEAQALWITYQRSYRLDWGLVSGLREYPPGIDMGINTDSGPIIFGAGASATAFGVMAARSVSDLATYDELSRLLSVAETGFRLIAHPIPKKLAFDPLAESIRFNAFTQPIK